MPSALFMHSTHIYIVERIVLKIKQNESMLSTKFVCDSHRYLLSHCSPGASTNQLSFAALILLLPLVGKLWQTVTEFPQWHVATDEIIMKSVGAVLQVCMNCTQIQAGWDLSIHWCDSIGLVPPVDPGCLGNVLVSEMKTRCCFSCKALLLWILNVALCTSCRLHLPVSLHHSFRGTKESLGIAVSCLQSMTVERRVSPYFQQLAVLCPSCHM